MTGGGAYSEPMKTATRILLCLALFASAGFARAERIFNQAELDALLAPVALYPDPILYNILDAASYPDAVRDAAGFVRANPQLRGDEALRAAEQMPWPPSVRALAAYPEVLARMDESPQWLLDLGDAYRVHGPYVMDTVQQLRRRAQASGYLQNNDQQQVYEQSGAIVVAPASPQVVYVRYYDPYVVYGPWWWAAYRPIVWQPWPLRRVVVVNHPVYVQRPLVVQRQVVVQRPVVVERQVVVNRAPVVVERPLREHREPPRPNGTPSPAVRMQQEASRQRQQVYQRVPESQRQPIVHSAPAVFKESRREPDRREADRRQQGHRGWHG